MRAMPYCDLNLPSQPPDLDANNNALVLDDLGEELAAVCFLVERLVEEDDATHAVCHVGTGGEKDVTEAAAVLLCVLHIDFLETLRHGALRQEHK